MNELDAVAERWTDEPTQPYARLLRGRVLVVEDDDALRRMIARIVSGIGPQVDP